MVSMNKQKIIMLVIAAALLAIGGAFWLQRKSPSIFAHSVGPIDKLPVAAPVASQAQTVVASSQSVAASNTATDSKRPFIKMGVLEANAVVDEIMKQDYASIWQSWLDAGRVEHDSPKQDAIASQLGGLLRQRPPPPEFLKQMREFIDDSSNSNLERGMLLGALQFAETKQTEKVLIEIAASASDDVTRSAMGSISMLGTQFGGANDEELAPALEQLWRESRDQTMILSVVKAMAQVGAPSSMELLLTAALAPNGQDDLHKKAALYALESVDILNDNAVPPLVARLSSEAPESEASKVASTTLARMSTRSAAQALVTWLQTADASAATFAREYATHTQFPEIWEAALNSTVPFRNEQNREAIRAGIAQFHAGRSSQF
jgi:hypothetical protein